MVFLTLTVIIIALQVAIPFPTSPECPEVASVVVDASLFAGVGRGRSEAASVADVVAEKVGVEVGAARKARVDDAAASAAEWSADAAEYLRVAAVTEAPFVSPIPVNYRSVTGPNLKKTR